jgi:hypothetical protein
MGDKPMSCSRRFRSGRLFPIRAQYIRADRHHATLMLALTDYL